MPALDRPIPMPRHGFVGAPEQLTPSGCATRLVLAKNGTMFELESCDMGNSNSPQGNQSSVRRYFIPGLLALLATIGAACAQPEPTPTPTPEPTATPMDTMASMPTATAVPNKPAPVPDIDQLGLAEHDVPREFSLNWHVRVDNRTVASERSDPERWMKNFDSWGRIDGLRAEFTNAPTGDSISSTANVYLTEDGAREAFRGERGEALRHASKSLKELGSKVVSVLDELEGPSIGNENFMIHARGSPRSWARPPLLIGSV